ncbi:MAG: LPP20 family lipoprotein [Treponema sp.]|jgi:hypothetical protein|nr:LPP20 family lipoprotein [Treponema sp.]
MRKNMPVLLALLAGSYLMAAGPEPRWVRSRELEYPDSRYISALGMGKDEEEAKNAALSGLALYFGTTIEVQQGMISRYNEFVSGNQKSIETGTVMDSAVKIHSQADFMGARLTSPWHNDQNRSWYILAYISKQEAAELYHKRINTNRMLMESFLEHEGEPLRHYQELKRAVSLTEMIESDITGLGNISPAGSEYREILRYIQRLKEESRQFRAQLRFSAAIEGDRQGRVLRKLLDVMEKGGYVTVRSQGDYLFSGEVFCDEETLPVGVFINAGIHVELKNSLEEQFFSYTKNYPRVGSRNQNMAYNIVFREIEKDLETNFIKEFNAFLGD